MIEIYETRIQNDRQTYSNDAYPSKRHKQSNRMMVLHAIIRANKFNETFNFKTTWIIFEISAKSVFAYLNKTSANQDFANLNFV